jgi:hypothetical protein
VTGREYVFSARNAGESWFAMSIPIEVCHNRVGPHRQRRPDKSLNLNYECHAHQACVKI